MLAGISASANAFMEAIFVNVAPIPDIEAGPKPTIQPMNKLLLIVSTYGLLQCTNHVDASRPLTPSDSGKVISERYYEVGGVRKVERRIIVTTQPQLETKLVTETLGR